MNSNDIRRKFLQFYEQRGHTVVASSSLIPAGDPTLLFANAGMNQFKDVFLGRETRSYVRAATSQKCVRAGGKHNDLDNVGHTRRHHTFFEMLGNFSFGDYFKKDAIDFAWTLLTKDFGLEKDRLWITVFRDDDEAADLWERTAGVARSRIVRMDERDNFWQMGDTGPCGPCSEIHYDLGPGASETGDPSEVFPSESGRYVEIWNLVFMQFDRDVSGRLTPLPKPSIDTGMGLERIAAVLQGKISNFECDLLRPIIDRAASLFGRQYGVDPAVDISLRIIADHIRATTFLISDGVTPSNEGRGYVLRKIMRRGIRQGTLLEFKGSFMSGLSGFVVDLMKEAYPDLVSNRDRIARVIQAEEQRFLATVSAGIEKLELSIADVMQRGGQTLPGPEIFKLYDTFGFPLDLTTEIAREKGVALDLAGFELELEKQRDRARQSWKGDAGGPQPEFQKLHDAGGTRFLGYEATESDATVLAILRDSHAVDSADGEGVFEVVLDQTPFYAESGGQVGDTGSLTGPRGVLRVDDTSAPVRGVTSHKAQLEFGSVRVGDTVRAVVDRDRRHRIAANHTATHLLHAALREALGTHVKQAGSLVAPDRLRFDYSHSAALTLEQIQEVESRVNAAIFDNHGLQTEEMELAQAIDRGAIAFFGEKYQDHVRVVSVPAVSQELCGGTHVGATGEIGLFKIVSDASIAAEVRRIEAVTGHGAYARLEEDEELLRELSRVIKAPRSELTRAFLKLIENQKSLERELDDLKRKAAGGMIEGLAANPQDVRGVPVVARVVEGVEPQLLRELAEQVSARLGPGVVVLGVASDGKASLVTVVSTEHQKRIPAGKLIKRVAEVVEGSGGGRPDFAQAGGKAVEKLGDAIGGVYNIVADFMV